MPKKYLIDGSIKFVVREGEIFGVGGSEDDVKSLYSAVKILESESAASSVKLINGSVITRG